MKMKLLTFFFSLSCCLLLASSGVIQRYPSVQSHNTTVTNKRILGNITTELLLIILENLNFLDLLDVAQTSKYFAFLGAYVFRQKLAHKTIEIGSFNKGITELLEWDLHTSIESSEVETTKMKSETKTTIILENYDLVLSTFQTFGADIKNLKIDLRAMTPKKQHEMYKLIKRYGLMTLKSLHLHHCDETTLRNFVVPFKGVETLTMTSTLGSTSRLRLNEIFPNLRHLNLIDVNILDANVLDVKLPHLTQFSVTVSIIYVEIYEFIETFIKRNSQIRDLSLNHINSYNYLTLASEHLKNLDRLQLNLAILSEEYNGPKLIFGSVKHLKMDWGLFDFSRVLSFNQLDSLSLTGEGSECVEFAGKFNSLTELNLVQRDLEDADLRKLTENPSNLKELEISSASEFEEQSIFHVIEMKRNLSKFTLKFHYGEFFDALKTRFGNEWNVKERAMEHDIEVRMVKRDDWRQWY